MSTSGKPWGSWVPFEEPPPGSDLLRAWTLYAALAHSTDKLNNVFAINKAHDEHIQHARDDMRSAMRYLGDLMRARGLEDRSVDK